jgi:hypothetical protein
MIERFDALHEVCGREAGGMERGVETFEAAICGFVIEGAWGC